MRFAHTAHWPAPAAQRTHLLHAMLVVRHVQERRAQPFVGTESVPVGLLSVLGPADAAVATPRARVAAYAGNAPTAAGLCRDADTPPDGLALAVESALADLAAGRPGATVCLVDAETVTGADLGHHLDVAAHDQLPVLFCCQNDHTAEGWPAASDGAGTVDGLDVEAVAAAADAMLHSLRAGGGPRLLRLRTDAGRDPVEVLAARMRNDHQLDDNALAAIDRDAAALARGVPAGA
jgi:hypothetical protein